MELNFDADGLIPAIVQHHKSGQVLMFAWMNDQALQLTQEQKEVVFWSRSRQTLWKKGETSGNIMRVQEILVDCDADVLLVKVLPSGPACHTGHKSCFFRNMDVKHQP